MYTTKEGNFNTPQFIGHLVLLLIGLVTFFACFGTVNTGEVGVKTRMSRVVGELQPGFFAKLPFVDDVHRINVRTLTINYDKGGDNGGEKQTNDNLFGASKDLQDVAIGVVVTYHINPAKATEIFSQYSSTENYQSNVIEPLIRETVKSTSAQYTAEELVTKRGEFSDKVNSNLATKLTEKSAILEKFSVTNFEFSKEFSKAINDKVTAVQNAEAAKNNLVKIQFEQQGVIEVAKAQAEAIRIQANAINSQGGADYVQLKAIEKWLGQVPTTMVPGATVPFINLKN